MATKLRVFLFLLVSSITTDSKLSEKREVFPKSMMPGNNPEDAAVNDAASPMCVSCYKMEKMLLELKGRVESIDNLIEKQLADLTANANCKPKSCSDLKVLDPSTPSGAYVIDPDGKGGLEPFTVYCDMSDKNGVGVTVISHDSESRMLVHGCNSAGCYRRDIHYTGANLPQLASLASVSLYCEQFVKYECRGSSFVYKNEVFGWWVSRHGIKMNYWGGASPGNGEQICACGMTNSCANSVRACNCDKNDLVWREDSGLLTDKTQLPVKQLRFGDTGDKGEQGYHTLGKLKCYGIA